jgi:hypothetical protein
MDSYFRKFKEEKTHMAFSELSKAFSGELRVEGRLCYVNGTEVDPAFDEILVPKDGTYYSEPFYALLRSVAK